MGRYTAETLMECAAETEDRTERMAYAQMATAEALIALTHQMAELAHALRTQR